ncbi:MAG: type I-C CRISPR-associated protein Cas5c [Ruminococcus sp.]
MKYKNEFSFLVSGDLALFSDPITRIGGEKSTLPIPTYAALIGVMKSIYWKPTLMYIIDSVKIINPIRTVSKGIRPIKYNKPENDLAMYTYLSEVAYAVKAHFIWNENHPELEADRNEDKHYKIIKRMIVKGGRRDVFLGTRECQAYVEPCDFESVKSFYDDKSNSEISFGLMYHSIIYADEAVNDEDKGKLTVCFHTPVMKNGQIDFIKPEDCTIKRHIKNGSIKKFGTNDYTPVDKLYEEVCSDGLDN